jgi:hypothetical protein
MTEGGQPYSYQRIVWPKGGGEPVEEQILPMPSEVDPSLFLDYFEDLYGPVIDDATTDIDGEQVPVGWVFAAPENLAALDATRELEVVVMPVMHDPRNPAAYVNVFQYQAQLKEDFISTMASHGVDTTIATVHQRAAGEEPEIDFGPDPVT